MIILGLFIISVLGLLFMSMLDVLVFKQQFLQAIVHLLPIYPDTSTIFIIAAAFLMAAWTDFDMTKRLKKKFGSQSNKQGGGENGGAKQNKRG
ncbi:hypothetical protein M3194_14620 [Paenibacillus glycanilyticus]|uniref:hypothetical protein n=1 Tax=Paenibacillus glycanilyticus TaxID=126569 RepID=UPI002041FB93|nr:hypothetical protein [Paenibacillus glycanilyticus]MCM3628594.1 hypothetical protein [Paenibacillus glycanilyticus]